MADEKPSWWTFVQGAATLALAGAAIWIQSEQDALRNRIDRAETTELFINRVDEYMKDESIEDDERVELRIAMLAIAARASRDDDDGHRQMLLPFQFALLADKPASLARLSNSSDAIIDWVPIAIESNDPNVKVTAAKALLHIVQHARDDARAVAAVYRLVDLIPDKPSDSLLKVATEVVAALDARWELQSTNLHVARGRLNDRLDETIHAGRLEAPKAGGGVEPLPTDEARRELVKELNSESAVARRNARSELAAAAAAELRVAVRDADKAERIAWLVDELEGKKPYRERLGALVALSELPSEVELPTRAVGAAVSALGDPNATIRKTAARLLVALRGPSRTTALAEVMRRLSQPLEEQADETAVFNMVVVAGELLETDDDESRSELIAFRGKLAGDSRNWSHTIRKVDEALLTGGEQALIRVFELLRGRIGGVRVESREEDRDWLARESDKVGMRPDRALAGLEYSLGGSLLFAKQGVYGNAPFWPDFCFSYQDLAQGEVSAAAGSRVEAGASGTEVWTRGVELSQDDMIELLENVRTAIGSVPSTPECEAL